MCCILQYVRSLICYNRDNKEKLITTDIYYNSRIIYSQYTNRNSGYLDISLNKSRLGFFGGFKKLFVVTLQFSGTIIFFFSEA